MKPIRLLSIALTYNVDATYKRILHLYCMYIDIILSYIRSLGRVKVTCRNDDISQLSLIEAPRLQCPSLDFGS